MKDDKSTSDDQIKEVENGNVVTPKGFQAAGIYSGVKRSRKDLGAIYSTTPANAAAVYTLNQIQAAPLHVTKESIAEDGKIQAIIVNSGNANACTGKQGEKDAFTMRKEVAEQFSVKEEYVAVASTGIIGLDMPMDKISSHIPKLDLGETTTHADAFNEAILTTDTFKKATCFEATIGGKTVTMGASTKGSGMIEPNMGTMLSFITTDAEVDQLALQQALKKVIDETFNCITVDGDTSTNDMVLLLANGAAQNEALTETHEDWDVFVQLLTKTCEHAAKLIAQDGEGATKLIEVEVAGAKTEEDARKVAKAIVGSSLVKTAVFGTDANWGRIIAAIGYSGVEINPMTIDMAIGPITLLHNSEQVEFSESEATSYLQEDEIHIKVDLHLGDSSGKAWGCDLTYDYVKINASYRS
ncbi:MAG TPA: bifunctional ornithine acetyltransferase/N-acetylglutamate synthase [Pseudogracilibacillus sp.]|nr:bifunctional ornithine acetyltransferase/N-acetylglutamate synthase [Pseudogracilibacillus sp.]